MAQIAPHIIDICAEREPIADIETQASIDLADIAFAGIGFSIMIIGVNRIPQRDIVSYRTIGQQSHRHGDPLFPERKLHRDVFEVSVRFVAHAICIPIMAPAGTCCYIEHKGQRIARCDRGWLRRVDCAIITHTEAYSSHCAECSRHILIHISVRIARIRRTRHILRRNSGKVQVES